MTKPMSMSDGIELEPPAGRLLVIAPGLAHDVEAVADSAFLLMLARGAQG